jgi:hypothetical protein
MTTTLLQIENLVGIIKLRESGYSIPALADFDTYTDVDLAEMLCKLAVGYLDYVSEKSGTR